MRLKFFLLSLTLLMLSISSFAASVADSVGVENLNGKKVIIHKADPKDNYFSIGRRYKVAPASIIEFNNNVPIKIGLIIKVPTDRPFDQPKQVTTKIGTTVVPRNNPSTANSNLQVTEYKVSAGETLYAIAKRFDSTVEDIMAFNNMTSNTLIPGQIIKVHIGVPPAVAPAPVVVQQPQRVVARKDSLGVVTSQDSANANRFNSNKYGLFEKNERGVATWIDDPSIDPSKKLVLHRTAPIGAVIKITNPMSGKTTFAKVVGRINDNDATKDVILVMTKNVAETIGALDKRVRVSITYGSPTND